MSELGWFYAGGAFACACNVLTGIRVQRHMVQRPALTSLLVCTLIICWPAALLWLYQNPEKVRGR